MDLPITSMLGIAISALAGAVVVVYRRSEATTDKLIAVIERSAAASEGHARALSELSAAIRQLHELIVREGR